MFLIYIFECMIKMFFCIPSAGKIVVLKTTGKEMTVLDFLTGYLGWLVIVLAVFGIIILIKYLRNREKLQQKWKSKKYKNNNPIKVKLIKICAVDFGIGVILFSGGFIAGLFGNSDIVNLVKQCLIFVGMLFMTISVTHLLFAWLWYKFTP